MKQNQIVKFIKNARCIKKKVFRCSLDRQTQQNQGLETEHLIHAEHRKRCSKCKKEAEMEDSALERLENGVKKLRSNETQMTAQQKRQYEKPLHKLRMQIKTDAEEVAKDFLLMGCRIGTEYGNAEKELTQRVQAELNAGQKHINEAFKKLLTHYDINQFITDLCPVHTAVWYKAYGPYWLEHCSENPMSDEFPYHNDLIDMDWWAEAREWAKTKMEDGKLVVDYRGGVTIMLPPTKELLQQDFKEELARG
jgi:hypothetical protein